MRASHWSDDIRRFFCFFFVCSFFGFCFGLVLSFSFCLFVLALWGREKSEQWQKSGLTCHRASSSPQQAPRTVLTSASGEWVQQTATRAPTLWLGGESEINVGGSSFPGCGSSTSVRKTRHEEEEEDMLCLYLTWVLSGAKPVVWSKLSDTKMPSEFPRLLTLCPLFGPREFFNVLPSCFFLRFLPCPSGKIWKQPPASRWGQLWTSQSQSGSVKYPWAYPQPLHVDLRGLRGQRRLHCGFTPLSKTREALEF